MKMNNNKIDLTDASDEKVLEWIDAIREEIIVEYPQLLKCSPDEIEETILGGMVEGYRLGELSRKDLARVFDLMGYVLPNEM